MTISGLVSLSWMWPGSCDGNLTCANYMLAAYSLIKYWNLRNELKPDVHHT